MRDLSDYFTATPEKTEVKGLLESQNTVDKTTESTSAGIIREDTDLNYIENSEKNKPKNVRGKTKKKKRKRSDPIVKNMTDMFSNSLSIISPKTSASTVPEIIENDENEVAKKPSKKSKQKNDCQLPGTDKNHSGQKHNASVLLASKENSGGYSMIKSEEPVKNSESETNTSNDSQNSKTKLNAFEVMMESRNKSIGQNSPGKELLDEQIGNDDDYKQKLSARKNLLQNWAEKKGSSKRKREEENRDEIINHKLNKRAKRFKKLLKVHEPVKVDEDSADVIVKKRTIKVIESSSESNKDSVEDIQNTIDILGTGHLSPVLDIVEENAQDKMISDSKSKESKQGLLSFFGILNKSKNNCNGNKNEDSKEFERSKAKMLNKKEGNMNSSVSLKKSREKKIVTDENSSEQNVIIEKKKKSKQKKTKKESNDLFSTEKSQASSKKQKKIEDENEDSLTPRSLRTWRMKIKLSSENNEDTKRCDRSDIKRTKRNISFTCSEALTDESSNEGKLLRRKKVTKSYIKEVVSCESDEDFVEYRRSKRCSVPPKMDQIILSDDDNSQKKSVSKKVTTVAPIFLKAKPKPKVAPEVLEARKQFLMSGIPSSLKKTIEKQQSVEEKEFDVFPSISHIQQKCESSFWALTKPELNLKSYLPLNTDQPYPCSELTNSHVPAKLDIQIEVKKVDKLKTLLNKIKRDNPNYPVYKSFRLIYEKSGKSPQEKQETKPKQKRKKKNADDSIQIIEPDTQEGDSIENAMWTEKYKPACSSDIIGNTASVKSIRKWLDTWLKFSQEIIVRKKKQRQNSTSESEFDTTDCDSRDSTKLPGNTIVLGGPCGSGKSTAIYAVTKELGYNVIELNASSKRTGKRLLQELQEATQSHQVRKNEPNLQNFLQSKTHKEKASCMDVQIEKKMCVLLIEDVDIVFEQDDGFITALTQLVTTSKRPIIMTTTDPNSVFVQRFISQYEYISFLRLSSHMLATWLQIVCLVEGLFVNRDDIGSLLEYNMGDVRKTLLELQFWVQSGGQIIRDEIPVKIESKRKSIEEKLVEDEPPLVFVKDQNKNREDDTFVHSNCVGSFMIFRDHKPYSIPYYLNLGPLWWNIPNILNIPNLSSSRLNRFAENTNDTHIKHKATLTDKIKLHSVEKFYDALAFTDVMFRKANIFDGSEPNVKNYSSDIRDSVELGECMDDYTGHSDFVHDATHSLVNGYIEEYNAIEDERSTLNMAVPDRVERRWRAKYHVCEDVLQGALSISSYVERRSIALDYMPSLRNISRSEFNRAAKNTKRGNRFRNYLRDLNINYNDSTLKLACNILVMNDE